jgi:hypothetical protein
MILSREDRKEAGKERKRKRKESREMESLYVNIATSL